MTATAPGPTSQRLARRLQHVECRNITCLSVGAAVFWERAHGCTVVDADGNEYLDTTAAFGVAALGHNHPAIVRAIQDQAGRLVHAMGDVHPAAVKVELCEALAECAPFTHGTVILAGGGAEAVEAALKTAAITTGKPGVVAFEGAYHGLSYGALATTHRADFRAPWAAQLGRHVTFAPFPVAPADVPAVLAAVEHLVDAGTPAGPVGAIVVEPIQGRGGVRIPPAGFLRELGEMARRMGALVIADEIFTGLGRTGTFWACDHDALVPDLVVCGKALGGGMPVGACIGSAAAMAGWPPSSGEALHTSTFLGNPVVCAAANAALLLLRAPELQQATMARGTELLAGLTGRMAPFPFVRAVRGRGLMLGVELDSAERCARAVWEGLQQRLLLLGGGCEGNVLIMTPPLTVTREEIDEILRRLESVFAACRN